VRIISGSAKGKKLAGFSGTQIRPTSDRVREALFNILAHQLGSFTGKTVLDLFAGTGAMGLEAVSRGARVAFMVDWCSQAANLVEANAKACRIQEKVRFFRGDVLKKLPELTGSGPFDLIFLDPPYGMSQAESALAAIANLGLLAERGIVCAEVSARDELPEMAGNLNCILRRRYGSTLIVLYSITDTKA
jgi:16S rRNA (guanine966-N2)-methyltransferase